LPRGASDALQDRPQSPRLQFSPTAWAKLIFLRDAGPTEIGAFAISAADDPLRVERIELVEQDCSPTSVSFQDEAVADFIDEELDHGLELAQCLRIWVHTHPGNCPFPSFTDEETFSRVFGCCDWAVMAILARGGRTYARIRFNSGPGGQMCLPIDIDYSREFMSSDHGEWLQQYTDCVRCDSWLDYRRERFAVTLPDTVSSRDDSYRLKKNQ
jgi:hypothetical protein